jgi:hypothetical protein
MQTVYEEINKELEDSLDIVKSKYLEEPTENPALASYSLRDVFDSLKKIQEILSTHKLIPIDNSSFDPTTCGFRSTNIPNEWISKDNKLQLNLYDGKIWLKDLREPYTLYFANIPCPNHSRGIELLNSIIEE